MFFFFQNNLAELFATAEPLKSAIVMEFRNVVRRIIKLLQKSVKKSVRKFNARRGSPFFFHFHETVGSVYIIKQ